MDYPSDNRQVLIDAIKQMVGFMNLDCSVEMHEEEQHDGKTLLVAVRVPDHARFLIGKNGQTLQALEHVVRAIAARLFSEPQTLVIDINDYKKARAVYIADIAKQIVTRVRSSQRAEALFPMAAYERRVVHMALAEYPDVTTESIGEGDQRRVVVKPLS